MKHFFDIGANEGQTFDWLKTQPNDYSDHLIWCFEPSPRHFAKLIARCKKESKKYDIRLCPFGFGGRSDNGKVAKLFEKDDSKGDSFYSYLKSDHLTKNINAGYETLSPLFTLSSFLDLHTDKNDEVVLDIDAEGAEYLILDELASPDYFNESGRSRNERLGRIKRIIAEFHFIGEGKERSIAKKNSIVDWYKAIGLPLEVRGFVK